MEQILTAWLTHYGAPALFVLLMLGVFGLPVPDETLLTFAGLLVSRGELRGGPVAIAGVMGAAAGITGSFVLGRYAGREALIRYGPALHVTRAMVDRVEQWFEHAGKWLLPVGYFVPGVRHLTAVVAGASGLPPWTFAVFAYLGAAFWVASFLLIGYTIGDEWRRLAPALHQWSAAAAGVAVLVVAGALLWRRLAATTGSR